MNTKLNTNTLIKLPVLNIFPPRSFPPIVFPPLVPLRVTVFSTLHHVEQGDETRRNRPNASSPCAFGCARLGHCRGRLDTTLRSREPSPGRSRARRAGRRARRFPIPRAFRSSGRRGTTARRLAKDRDSYGWEGQEHSTLECVSKTTPQDGAGYDYPRLQLNHCMEQLTTNRSWPLKMCLT